MGWSVTQADILSLPADAAVLGLEITMQISDGAVCQRLAAAGGEKLREELRRMRYLPIGSACAADPGDLPFAHLILTAVPRWLTGKSNELLALRRCYESVFSLAEELGCLQVAMPFFSVLSYRFPQKEAVHIAVTEAEKHSLETVFVADTPELMALSRERYRKPEITDYIGYYRDHAIFALDNGLFARVDLRPERRDVAVIPYFEACYRTGNNPLQPALAEAEIERLRKIYEDED